jgi:hypothetical protein
VNHDLFWEKVVEGRYRAARRLREYGEAMKDHPGQVTLSFDHLRAEAEFDVTGKLLCEDESRNVDLTAAIQYLRTEMVRMAVPTNSLLAAAKNEARRERVASYYSMVLSAIGEPIRDDGGTARVLVG